MLAILDMPLYLRFPFDKVRQGQAVPHRQSESEIGYTGLHATHLFLLFTSLELQRMKSRTILRDLIQKVRYENKRNMSLIQTNEKIRTSRLELSLTFSSNKQKWNSVCLSQYTNRRNFSVASTLNMRFVQFTGSKGGPQRLGVQLAEDGDIFDISGVDSSIPNSLVKFLKSGDDMMEKTKRIVAEGKSVFALSEVRLLPPLTSPDKIACVGLNYKGHCDEQNIPYPKEPVFFSKWSSCIVGPNASVELPSVTKEFDWEVELAVVIGKQGKDIRKKDAINHVFGYSVAVDLTARDWQKKRNGGQWLLGKSMDGACPLGPAVVIKEVVPDPHTLPIRCKVNGEVKQDANTNELINRIDFIISYLSRCCTLLPGDVILTGTPSGVGLYRNPPEFLKAGDIIESEIEGVGKLKTIIV
ncbi:hypothetical protein L9F63_004286 [Diploptera punctata]|uniref:Fumarylacetoacetase-like C-terminal domain-containing protein n=1 Tax=Diploptera punctata TaxID=6984 RepID=A0AAD8E7X9_DIPPU|nr:hypothetical protein L9F63_004286 [Diploptera punctata]